jgi:hypothetical protein
MCRALVPLGERCSEVTRPYLRCDPAQGQCLPEGDGGFSCVAFAPTGAPCTGSECAPTDFCRFDSSTLESRCAAKLDAGAPCGPNDACKEIFCTSAGVCGPLPTGASCRSQGECLTSGAPQACVGVRRSTDGGVIPGQCGPARQLGESCTSLECDQSKALACSDGVCRPLTPFSLDAGAECLLRPWGVVEAPFYGFATCARDLACLPDVTAHPPQTGRCGLPLGLGAPCRDVQSCRAGLDCAEQPDGGARQCAPLRARGQTCGFTFPCDLDSRCVDLTDAGTRCEPLGTAGAPCGYGGECAPGLACGGNTCVAPNGGCQYDFECLGGACQVGVCRAMCIR